MGIKKLARVFNKMHKNVVFGLKKQPFWLQRTITALFLSLILIFLVMAGLGLWGKLLMFLIVVIVIVILAYASYCWAKIL